MWSLRGVFILPTRRKLLVAGSKTSAESRVSPDEPPPPLTSTLPSVRSVAACRVRGIFSRLARTNRPSLSL